MCQTVASYSSISGSRRAIGAGLGSERSMWQRQTQLRLFSAAPRRRPIGCGSWTMIVSHSPCRPSALISLISSKIAHCSSLSVSSAPCSELCRSLVALKNSSLPKITCQWASRPASRISGTSV